MYSIISGDLLTLSFISRPGFPRCWMAVPNHPRRQQNILWLRVSFFFVTPRIRRNVKIYRLGTIFIQLNLYIFDCRRIFRLAQRLRHVIDSIRHSVYFPPTRLRCSWLVPFFSYQQSFEDIDLHDWTLLHLITSSGPTYFTADPLVRKVRGPGSPLDVKLISTPAVVLFPLYHIVRTLTMSGHPTISVLLLLNAYE